jgi:hypothetical protein
MKKEQQNKKLICPWCRHETEIVWVHGHGQCIICKINIDECCRGEQCDLTYNESVQKGKNFQGEYEQAD